MIHLSNTFRSIAPSSILQDHQEDIEDPGPIVHEEFGSLGTMTLRLCQRDSSFHSELCFDSEIRLAFENIFYSERVAVQSYPDLNDDAYSD